MSFRLKTLLLIKLFLIILLLDFINEFYNKVKDFLKELYFLIYYNNNNNKKTNIY
jgi:hypothetical protein